MRYDIATDQSDKTVIAKIGQVAQKPVIGGGVKEKTDDDKADGDFIRMVLPYEMFQTRKYKKWCAVYEDTFALIAYSTETIKLDWWQTGLFKFVLTAIMLVATVYRLAMLDLSAITDMSTFMTVFGSYMETMAINYGIGEIGKLIAEQIGGDAGALIGALFSAVASFMNSGISLDMDISELWLPLANMTFKTIAQGQEFKMMEFVNDAQATMEKLSEENKELADKINAMGDESVNLASVLSILNTKKTSSNTPDPVFQTIEQYVNSVSNPEMFVAGGPGMYNIDAMVSIKQNVITGSGR